MRTEEGRCRLRERQQAQGAPREAVEGAQLGDKWSHTWQLGSYSFFFLWKTFFSPSGFGTRIYSLLERYAIKRI